MYYIKLQTTISTTDNAIHKDVPHQILVEGIAGLGISTLLISLFTECECALIGTCE